MIAGKESSRKKNSQTRSEALYNKLHTWTEKCAETTIGQFLIEMTDRTLKIVEETAKWSLPREENDAKLVRPLPWILFFALIIWLRALRILFTTAALVMGNNAITPQVVVYFIQDQRCKLQALRARGSKSIKQKGSELTANPDNKLSLPVKLGKLLSRAICRPGYINEIPSSKVIVQKPNVQITESDSTSDNNACTPVMEREDIHFRLGELLNKYANRPSDDDDDPDYVPSPRQLKRTSSASNSSDSDNESETSDLLMELQELVNDKGKVTTLPLNENSMPQKKATELRENGSASQQLRSPSPRIEYDREPLTNTNRNVSHQIPIITKTFETNNITEEGRVTSPMKCEVVPDVTSNSQSPQTTMLVTQTSIDESKSTPGHETAATLRPPAIRASALAVSSFNTTPTSASQSSQTPIDVDFIVANNLEKLECAATLTCASSSEDVFYSPIGSPQTFYNAFYPSSVVEISPLEGAIASANITTAAASKDDFRENNETSTGHCTQPKKVPQKTTTNHNSTKSHYHHKNRGKNRR
ncbi:jabba isoform 1-T4 [Glossina fuscipes fuscipes]